MASMSQSTASLARPHSGTHEGRAASMGRQTKGAGTAGTGGGATVGDSFADKMGTLGRSRKKLKEEEEAEEVVYEGRYAIDSSGIPVLPETLPEECQLEEGEERRMVSPESREDPKVAEVIRLLVDWINDELADQRIIVKDIQEDMYDGQVVQKLMEKLSGVKTEVPEVSQSAEGQRQKLRVVVQILGVTPPPPAGAGAGGAPAPDVGWTPDAIHKRDLPAILRLLVALALHFRAPIRFPEHAQLTVLVVQKKEGKLRTRHLNEQITGVQTELGARGERDAFDTLFDYGPDKLANVKTSLQAFANKHLNKINLEVTDLDTQFQDGVYLVLLMGLLEGYFVPLYSFHLQTTHFQQKVKNVSFSFELMQDAGMPKPRARPEDIVNGDLKSTLRVLHTLFTKYKFVS